LGAHDAVVDVVVDVASRNNRMTAYASADNHGGTTGDVGRTTTATAAAMIPPSSSSSSSSSGTHFPNWRVVDPRRGEDDRDGGRAIRSPFCHSPSPSSTDGGRDGDDDDDYYDGRAAASQSHDAAPWSESAYRSSLDLHDRIIAGMGMTDPPTTTTTTDGEEEEEDGIASLARRALHDIGSAYRLHGPYCTIRATTGGRTRASPSIRRGERRRRPLPPENHDSARAGGPYATKAILQEEGSGHHGGHDQQ
jgi:hypothetical protein